MHAQNRYAGIDGIDVAVRHVLGDGSAAALVDLAHLGHLPDHLLSFKEAAEIADDFRRSVAGGGLASCSGVLADRKTVVELGLAALLRDFRIQRVKGGRDIGREAETVLQAAAQRDVLCLAEVLHEAVKGRALHAAHALGPDLFLVGKNADAGPPRRLEVKHGLQLRPGADPVVVAVSADHGAVQTNLTDVEGGNGCQLRREEIFLRDSVCIVQQAQHRKSHAVFSVVGIGDAADQDVQTFSGDAFGHRLFHLVLRQVREQIRNDELRLSRFPADADFHRLAVFQRRDAVQLQGNGHPLVLLDAAVIVGAEIAEFILLIHRDLFQVETGGIDVGAGNHGSLLQGFFPDHGQHQGLAAVDAVYPVSRIQHPARLKRPIAKRFRLCHRIADRFPFGARFVQEVHILAAVFFDFNPLLGSDPVIAVLLFIKQLISHVLHLTVVPPDNHSMFG